MITFRNKKFNIVFSIVSVVMILFTILVPCFSVNAQSQFDFVSDFGLSDTSNYFTLDGFHASDVYNSDYFSGIESYEVAFDITSSDISNISSAVNGSTSVPIDNVNIDDYFINNSLSSSNIDGSLPQKVSYYHKQNDGFELVFFYLPDDSFVQINSSGSFFIYSSVDNQIPAFVYYTATKGYTVYSFPSATTVTIDDKLYYSYLSVNNQIQYNRLLTSSVPLYLSDSLGGTTEGKVDYNYTSLNSSGSGGGVSDQDIIDNKYLGLNNYIGITGSSINNADLKLIVDLNSDQMKFIDHYSYTINITFYANALISNSKGSSMLSSYGYSVDSSNASGSTFFDKTFTGSISDSMNSNIISIGSTVYNDDISSSGKTAVKFTNWVTNNVSTAGVYTASQEFQSIASQVIFKNPLYTSNNAAELNQLYYDLSATIYYDGVSITNVPIAGTYNAISGQNTLYSNPGVDQSKVDQVIDDNNQGLQPGDDGFLNKNDYQGTISVHSGNSSASGGSGGNIESGAIVINNNPTFNNNTSSSSESGLGGGGLIGFITGLIIGNKKSSTDSMEEMVNSSGWFGVINQVYGFVPVQVWNLVFGAFTAAIGIVIVSFIISIVIKFIT